MAKQSVEAKQQIFQMAKTEEKLQVSEFIVFIYL